MFESLRRFKEMRIVFSFNKLLLAGGLLLAVLFQPQEPAFAAAVLTVTPITWNVVGLDSNNVNVGPNHFPVGARICNTGDAAATNVKAVIVWDSSNSYINLRPGSLSTIMLASLAGGNTCSDVYFEVEITRTASAYDTTRRYHIQVTSDQTGAVNTPVPREIYVEHLISQNRNGVTSIKLNGAAVAAGGTMTLMVGNTYTIELDGFTATQGYNQLESFINFPNTIFQVLSVSSTYTADTSPYVANPSSQLYADACLWESDPTSPNYRSCVGGDYKAGGTVTNTYTVKIIGGAGTTQTLNTLLYDFSGSSYHYNSDFSASARYVSIVGATLTKAFSPKTILAGGTATLAFIISNPGTSSISSVNFTDTLPSNVSVANTAVAYSGCGASPSPSSLSVGATSLSFANITVSGASTCTINVSVTASANGIYNNTTGDLYIGTTDTGSSASDSLSVSSLPSPPSSCASPSTLAAWTFENYSAAASTNNGPFSASSVAVTSATGTYVAVGGTAASASGIANPTTYPAGWSAPASTGNSGNSWGILDGWPSANPTAGNETTGTTPYFQFQVNGASQYGGIGITANYNLQGNWSNSGNWYVLKSTDGATWSLANSAAWNKANSWQTGAGGISAATTYTGNATVYFRIYAAGAQYTGGGTSTATMYLDGVQITGCQNPNPPTLSKSFSPTSISTGSTSTLTFTINNPNSGNALTGVSFSDVLPSGLTVSNSSSAACGGTLTTTSPRTISLSGGTLAASGSCTINVTVTGAAAGSYTNVSSSVSSTASGPNTTSSGYGTSSITVVDPPVITKDFGAVSILTNNTTSLTFTITNPNAGVSLTGVSFTDSLPGGLVVATPAGASNTCGTLTASAGSSTVSLSNASIPAGSSCTVTLNVLGTTTGVKSNSVSVNSANGGTGNTASADLLVKDPTPSISLSKQISTSSSGPWYEFISVAPGTNIYYRFIMENTGDVALTAPTVSDPNVNTSSCTWTSPLPVASAAQDPTETCVVGPVTAASGDNPNTATASGTYNGTIYTAASSADYIGAAPGFSLLKQISASANGPWSSSLTNVTPGSNLYYKFTLVNTGAVALSSVNVTDVITSINTLASACTFSDPLNVNSATECVIGPVTASSTAGTFTNTATAHGTNGGTTYDSPSSSASYTTGLPDLTITKTDNVSGTDSIGTSFNWTLTVSNSGATDANFANGQTILTDVLPSGAAYGSPAAGSFTNITNSGNVSCSISSGTLSCAAIGGPITIGPSGSFTVVFSATPTTSGSLANTATVDPNNNVGESNESNNTASDTVVVLAPPAISKSFSPNPIGPGGVSTLTFTIANSNAAALNGIAFTDTFPTGLTVASAPSASQCNGAVSSTSGSISLSGGSIAANSSCTVTVNVTASAGGTYSNVSGAVSSTNGGTGNTASAKLGVISAVKTIAGTSEDSTSETIAPRPVLIGEIVRYHLVMDLPEGTTANLTVLDNLVTGMRYLNDGTTKIAFVCNSGPACASSSNASIGSGPVISGNTGAVTPTFVLPSSAITNNSGGGTNPFPDGNDPLFNLGTITNNDNDADAEYVVIEFNALVDNVSTNGSGNTRGNTFTVFVNGANVVTSTDTNNSRVTIREPLIDSANFVKSVTVAPNDAGDSITYQIKFTNSGTAPAFDILLTDALDPALTTPVNITGSTTGGACGSTASTVSGSYTAPNATAVVTCLAAGGTATINISAVVSNTAPAGKAFSNSASLTYTSLPGTGTPNGNGGNTTGSTTPGSSGASNGERNGSGGVGTTNDYVASSNTVRTALASPSLAKDINPSGTNYAIGAAIPYRIQITVPEGVTGGPAASLADVIPNGLNYVSGSLSVSLPSGVTVGTAGTLDDTNSSFFNLTGQTMTLTFGSITSQASSYATTRIVTVTFQAQVANVIGNQSGTTFTNSASFTYSDPNNSGSTLTLNASAPSASVVEPDLTISKNVSSTTPAYNSTLTYTLTIAHSSSSNAPAYDTHITDAMPSGLTGLTNINVSGSPGGCAAGVDSSASTSSGLDVTIGTIPLGCTVTITYNVTVSGPLNSTQTNNAAAAWTSLPGSVSGERTGADGVGGALNDYAAMTSAQVTVSGPDLRVTKDDGSATYLPGESIVYTITVYNDGNVTASGTVTDNPPAALTNVSWTCAGSSTATCGASGADSINDSVSIAAGQHVTYTLKAIAAANAAGDLSNTASAALSGGTDPTPANNSATDTDASGAVPGLTVKKSSTTASISATGVVSYSYLITNTGNVTVTGISVADNNIDSGSMSCPGASLAAGANMTCTAQHTVTQAEMDAGGNLSNTVTVTSANAPTATDTLNIPIMQNASLSLTKSANPAVFTASGQTVTYTYTLTNNGNVSLASPYTLTDDKVAGANISCASAVSPLAPGASTTCSGTYSTTASDVSAGSVTNTASAKARFGSTDVSSSSAQAVINLAALSVTKAETSTGPYAVNDTITYSITVTNTGTATLTGVTVSDPGSGATLGACSPSIPTTLTAGASVTCAASHVVTQADIDAGSYSNTASGTSDQVGPQTSAVKINFTQTPALSLTKSASPTTYGKVGDTINYSYILKNTGNVTLTSPFTVTDDKTSVTCPSTPTDLAPGDAITCTAAYSVVTADLTNGSVINHAVAHARFGSNTVASNQDSVTVSARPGSLTGIVFNDANANGMQDSGEAGLANVTIDIYDSAGTTLITSATTDSQGHYSAAALPPGNYLVMEQDPGGYVSTTPNAVAVSVPANGVAQADFGDHQISGTDNNNISGIVFNDANSNGIFDNGEQILSGVTITLYDQNSHLISATTAGINGAYNFNNLPPGIYTVVETNPAGYISTTLDHVSVSLSSGTNAVVNYGDEQSDATIIDPAVAKYGDPSTAHVGDTVIYTITVGNNGNADALDVVLTDTKPAFLDIVSINVSPNKNFPAVISGNTFTINFGTVTPTDFYTVTVLTKVNSLGRPPGGDNNASITTSSLNEPTFNDSASVQLTIPSNAHGNGGGAYWSLLPHTGFAPGVVTSVAPEPANIYDTSSGLTIEIPALGVKTSIVGVPQSGDSWDVTWLGNQVGYLDGTAFPTWSGNSVLTGHVYGSDGLPGPFVNLHTLKWGDQIIIHFQGQRYIYEVRENKVVSPTDMSVFKHENQPWITLLTCKDYNASTNTYAHRVEVGAVLVQIVSDADPSGGR